MIRTHLTWSGKARDLPRFSQVYADVVPAVSGRHASEDVQAESNPSRISVKAAGLPQSWPAADRVS
jgi:hypothetical protein